MIEHVLLRQKNNMNFQVGCKGKNTGGELQVGKNIITIFHKNKLRKRGVIYEENKHMSDCGIMYAV